MVAGGSVGSKAKVGGSVLIGCGVNVGGTGVDVGTAAAVCVRASHAWAMAVEAMSSALISGVASAPPQAVTARTARVITTIRNFCFIRFSSPHFYHESPHNFFGRLADDLRKIR
jgi:hypothetical protein